MIISELKKHFTSSLSDLYTDSESGFIFQIFAEDILALDNVQQRHLSSQQVSLKNSEKFLEIISELKTGKPYLQILGKTEFYGLIFFVDGNVLIPRPETEELLEIAINRIQHSDLNLKELKIIDIGTGTGIIPIVLKKHFPDAKVTSIDFSEKALETAKKNATYHQLDINFIHADYLKYDLNENFDVMISNPPYIGINEQDDIADSVKQFEPKMALFSPTSDALIFYKRIAEDSKKYLNKNGFLFLEINQKLGLQTLNLYTEKLSNVSLIKDLSMNDRFIVGKL